MIRSYLSLLIIALVVSSCRQEVIVPIEYQEEQGYFPLVTGNRIRYQVDSIVHIENESDPCEDSVDHYSFEIMEVVDAPFIDGEGETAYKIFRYRRADSLQEWSFCGLWTAKLNLSSAEKVEENVRYVKLAFPFDRRSTWNGNAYNSQTPESYKYEDIKLPYSINGFDFPSTVKVLQNDFVTSIGAIVKWEKYAKNVGMVEKYYKDVRLLYGCGSAPVIDDGLEYSMKLIDYDVQ